MAIAKTDINKNRIAQDVVQGLALADSAAFDEGRADSANMLLEESGLRIDEFSHRGRAAGLNPAGRFEQRSICSFDDGWDKDEALPALKTTVQAEKALSIITSNKSPDIHFDRSINPYRGCEHGCIYCFARPSHSYMGLSAGLDFETQLFAKPDAAKLLERELAKPGYKPRVIAIGTNTDPYQPVEKHWAIMRAVLAVLYAARHPVSIVTKSALILRDLDILTQMAEHNLVQVVISVTTLDGRLARKMEPRAASPQRRLYTIKQLAQARVPVAVMVAPVIPGLNDHEIERILAVASDMGAISAGYVMLRLPYEVAPLFKDWLLREYPDRYRRVMTLVRSMREGKDYDADWRTRMRGSGPFAEMVARRFRIARSRLGLGKNRVHFSCEAFVASSNGPVQLSLF